MTSSSLILVLWRTLIVFTVNEHRNICIAGRNRQADYATGKNSNRSK